MKTSQNGIAVVQYFESCQLKAYPDPLTGGDPWTCGWGDTGADVGPETSWTQAQADARLAKRLVQEFEPMANAAIKVPVTQGQFDAFMSLLFNVGPGRVDRSNARGKDGIVTLRDGRPSTLLRKLNAGDFAGARAEWSKWVSPGTSVERGLRRRRVAEQALFDGLSSAVAIKLGAAA